MNLERKARLIDSTVLSLLGKSVQELNYMVKLKSTHFINVYRGVDTYDDRGAHAMAPRSKWRRTLNNDDLKIDVRVAL